jgi:hypothetical protein
MGHNGARLCAQYVIHSLHTSVRWPWLMDLVALRAQTRASASLQSCFQQLCLTADRSAPSGACLRKTKDYAVDCDTATHKLYEIVAGTVTVVFYTIRLTRGRTWSGWRWSWAYTTAIVHTLISQNIFEYGSGETRGVYIYSTFTLPSRIRWLRLQYL